MAAHLEMPNRLFAASIETPGDGQHGRNIVKWVKLKRYCEISGDTPDAVQKKVARGIWLDSHHIKTAGDGARWVNTEAVDNWVENGIAGDQADRANARKRRRAAGNC